MDFLLVPLRYALVAKFPYFGVGCVGDCERFVYDEILWFRKEKNLFPRSRVEVRSGDPEL